MHATSSERAPIERASTYSFLGTLHLPNPKCRWHVWRPITLNQTHLFAAVEYLNIHKANIVALPVASTSTAI
jgi:hypothetical protein